MFSSSSKILAKAPLSRCNRYFGSLSQRRSVSTTPPQHPESRSHAIAFVGLGAMGREMAQNLFSKTASAHEALSESHGARPRFVVCDASPAAAASFASSFQKQFPAYTVDVVENPGEAALHAATLITMLPSSPQVNDVYLGPSGILPALSNVRSLSDQFDTLAIDSTTLDVTTAKDVAARLKDGGVRIVDAPVSGGVVGAKAASLSFMVGGPEESFELARPHLARMGKKIVHCGEAGNGLAVKICNNLILGINQIAVAEAMLLGTSLGLSPGLLASVINNSTGHCWPSSVNNPVPGALPGQSPPCERDFNGGFASKLMLKDLNLARNAAQSVNVPLPLGASSIQIYEDVAQDQDMAAKDFSVVFRYLQQQQSEPKKQ